MIQRLLVVSDNPSLHRGFATVGRHIARALHASGRWRVEYVGRYQPASRESAEPYPVIDVEPGGDEDEDTRRTVEVMSSLLRDVRSGEPITLLSIGTAFELSWLLDQLDATGLRSRVRIVAYIAIDYAPLPPSATRLLQRVECVVPFTGFARRALLERCRDEGPIVMAPLPHGVDASIFRPLEPAARARVRRELFGVDDNAVVVGYFGRNSAHKRPDLALRVFAAFAHRWPDTAARLYVHTEQLSLGDRMLAGGWDLDRLAAKYGIRDRVVFDRSLRLGEGIAATELASRMSACDIHLLPYEGGGWELTVLETGACAVPNVITNAGAPPHYAASFSELVPPAARILGPTGLRAFMDIDLGAQALSCLARDGDRRRRLGQRGVEVAAAHDWSSIGERWNDVLSEWDGHDKRRVGGRTSGLGP